MPTWEMMFQLGRPSMACVIAWSRQIMWKKGKTEQKKIGCHVMHLKNSIKSKRKSRKPKKCWENDEKTT